MPWDEWIDNFHFIIHDGELYGKHHLPHTHVEYQGEEILLGIDNPLQEGSFKSPRKTTKAKKIIRKNLDFFLEKWDDVNPE